MYILLVLAFGVPSPLTAVQTLRLASEDLLPHLAGLLGAVMGKRAAQVLLALHITWMILIALLEATGNRRPRPACHMG